MLKTFPIDFIRQALEQKLLQEHLNNVNYFGGKDQVSILSFYEQLKSQDQVDRFVETYRDLSEQQNRTGLILNGVLVSPENPTITNLYSSLIVPMTFTCSFRCKLENRDQGIATINNLIENLKGRKVDIAQLNCIDNNKKEYCEPFMVGTIGQGNGIPTLKNGDYIGDIYSETEIIDLIHALIDKGVVVDYENVEYLYFKDLDNNKLFVCYQGEYESESFYVDYDSADITNNRYITINAIYSGHLYESDVKKIDAKLIIHGDEDVERNTNFQITQLTYDQDNNQTNLILAYRLPRDIDEYVDNYAGFTLEDFAMYLVCYNKIEDDGTYEEIIFPPTHTSFEKYKVSFSFDAVRCDEPRNLNGSEYCELSFGGSATLVNNKVKLGNDLLKVSFHKNKIVADPNIDLSDSSVYYLEPLEMPSGSNANTQISQLMSNKFISNSHTDSLALTLQYTFIADDDILLLNQWFNYARYGTQDTTNQDIDNRISPNIIYDTIEYWCSWGNYETKEILTKIVGDISIENTESDTLTIGLSMQIQGENN